MFSFQEWGLDLAKDVCPVEGAKRNVTKSNPFAPLVNATVWDVIGLLTIYKKTESRTNCRPISASLNLNS